MPVKPQDACCYRKGSRRRDCSSADLPQSGVRSEGGRLGFDKGRSLLTKGSIQGFKKGKKENFVKEKQKTKQLITSHPGKNSVGRSPIPESTFFLHLNPSMCAKQETILL